MSPHTQLVWRASSTEAVGGQTGLEVDRCRFIGKLIEYLEVNSQERILCSGSCLGISGETHPSMRMESDFCSNSFMIYHLFQSFIKSPAMKLVERRAGY
jgi:hypothetical protein